MGRQGKFIVIDGTDGSGKATQANLLVERLIKNQYPVFKMEFPQYGHKSAGLIEEYLRAQKYGSAESVGPYRASIFYACDRYDASFKIRQALAENKIVISDRYVTANMAHQGGKIIDSEERKKFFAWLEELEYGIFAIPRPDLNIILHVDTEISQNLIDHRAQAEGIKRDLHEADIDHLKHAEQVYFELVEIMPHTKMIECTEDGKMMSRQRINEILWHKVLETINSND
jgi:dTMP kinase